MEVGGREKNNKDWLIDNGWEGGELKALYIHERGVKVLGSDWPELDQFILLYTSPTKNVVP